MKSKIMKIVIMMAETAAQAVFSWMDKKGL
jgi:hypothetical protein